MMVSEVPQIDLSSLSQQQLQHLLEISRRAGRTEMADAVAHEMRERRARPEAPRSWVEVDFHEVASEPDLELEPSLQIEPEPEPQIAPADPYAFSTLRMVPDGGLRINQPAPRRTAGKARAPVGRTNARIAGPRRAHGAVLGGVVALGLAAVAAMVPLQRSSPPPVAPPKQVAAQAAPRPPEAAAVGEVLPRASTVRFALRGPIDTAAAPAAAAPAPATPSPPPAPSREFTIAAADLRAAAESANQADMAKAHGEGLQGTWITPDFAAARCRWSRTDSTLAVCQTRTRYDASRPWRERTGHYRRDADGVWQVAP